MTLSEDDRLWRDQNIPNVSDEQLEKIIHTFSVTTEKTKENKGLTKYYVQKYSNDYDKILAEAILIKDQPFFLVSQNGEISINPNLEVGNKILEPLESMSYVNKAYSFDSKEQVYEYVEKAMNENLDTIYRKVKSTWKKYVDADDFHISICAADIIFTHFQDKIGLTHYLFFVGSGTSGKSNNLTVFQYLGYRNMTSTDISYQNIYQYLGSQDEGVGTICEDEADTIDEDNYKMRIYKNGYITGRPVTKIDTNTPHGRVQYKFNTFCFKAFAAERLPDSLKAKGFNQRILEIPCFYGFPEFDISEVVNPVGEEKFQELLNELLDIRKTSLIYRLLHYNDKIPDIKTNLKNRERQLFKPVLRVFQNTETFKELLPVISKYINQKRENNSNTLYAYVYKVIKHLVKQENSHELKSSLIWETITQPVIKGVENPVWLNGESITGKTLSYNSVEFAELSQKLITEICKDVFGAEKSKKGSVKWTFDKDKLKRIGKIYSLPSEIEIKTGSDANVDDMDDVDDVGDIGLDKYSKEQRKTDNLDDNQEEV